MLSFMGWHEVCLSVLDGAWHWSVQMVFKQREIERQYVRAKEFPLPSPLSPLTSHLHSPLPPPPQRTSAETAALAAQSKLNLQSLPIRSYLDQTVVPLMLQGLSALVKERYVHPALSAVLPVVSPSLPPSVGTCLLLFLSLRSPPDPVEWLAQYMLKNNPQKKK